MLIEGIEIGIILNLLTIFNTDVLNIYTIVYILCSSHWVYGGDRYLDSRIKVLTIVVKNLVRLKKSILIESQLSLINKKIAVYQT